MAPCPQPDPRSRRGGLARHVGRGGRRCGHETTNLGAGRQRAGRRRVVLTYAMSRSCCGAGDDSGRPCRRRRRLQPAARRLCEVPRGSYHQLLWPHATRPDALAGAPCASAPNRHESAPAVRINDRAGCADHLARGSADADELGDEARARRLVDLVGRSDLLDAPGASGDAVIGD